MESACSRREILYSTKRMRDERLIQLQQVTTAFDKSLSPDVDNAVVTVSNMGRS